MVRWTRSARIVPAKYLEAVQWGKDISDYTTKKFNTKVDVYVDSFGEFGTIRWFCDFADLAAVEDLQKKILADQEYLQKVSKAAELLIPGTAFDMVMRSI